MKKRWCSSLIFPVLAITVLTGCGENGSLSPLDTKSVSGNAQLTIRIEGSQTQQAADTNDTQTGAIPHENQAPVAKITTVTGGQTATDDFIYIHAGDTVTFSGQMSNDTDGNITTYIWSDMDNNVLSTDVNFTRTFYDATVYEKTLTLIDDKGAFSQQRVCVLADITPDAIPLMANAGPDLVVAEGTVVPLRGHVTCKNGNYSYAWSENGKAFAQTQNVEQTFTPGVHEILLTVTDNQTGAKAYDTAKITVTPAPETPVTNK